MEVCLADISVWMFTNIVKLNHEKTEGIASKLKHEMQVNNKVQLQFREEAVHVARSVKNLDMYFDTPLTTERQVNAISNACYNNIRKLLVVSGRTLWQMLTKRQHMPW